MNQTVVTAIIAGVFGLGGAIIGVVGALFIAARRDRIEEQRHLRELRMEDRRHFRELGLKVGLTNFEHCSQLAQSAANRYQQMFAVPPLKAFFIQGVKLMEIVSDERLTADEMARRIAESEDFTQAIIQAAKQKHDA